MKIFFSLLAVFVLGWLWFKPPENIGDYISPLATFVASPSPSPRLSPTPIPLPQSKFLDTGYHVFQSFNNCGPAALSMALTYYDISISQQELGRALRPFQNPQGDNDDKSVTLAELAEKAKEYNLVPYHRPNGRIELVKQFLNQGWPVITRTLTKTSEDIGHFRVIKGFDNTAGEFVQDDSLQGKNLRYSYSAFDDLWQRFNYEYLVLVPADQTELAEFILGEEIDEQKAWKNSLSRSSDDFNLSIALYYSGDYAGSVEAYEKVAAKLPMRTLWYQIEPILAYYELGNYAKVLSITDSILNNGNRAFAELYLIRANVFEKQNDPEKAKQEREKASYYNPSPISPINIK